MTRDFPNAAIAILILVALAIGASCLNKFMTEECARGSAFARGFYAGLGEQCEVLP